MGRPSKRYEANTISAGSLIRVYTAKGAFTDKVTATEDLGRVTILTIDVNGKPVEKAYLADEMVKVVSTHVQDTNCTTTKEDFPEDGSLQTCPNGGLYWEHYSHPLPADDEEADPFA